MTKEEARQIFLSRGFVEVEGGTIYDPDKWREACVVISEWLEQEPTTVIATGDGAYYKIKACEDAISRQALLDDFGLSEKTRKWGGDHSGYNTMMLYEIQDMIESAPSVKPQEPKTGHWIIIDDCEKFIAKCSECGQIEDSRMVGKYAYCHCGARMVESQERSE